MQAGKAVRNRPILTSSLRVVKLWRSSSKTRTTTHPTPEIAREWRHQIRQQVQPSQPPATRKKWLNKWSGLTPPTTTQLARSREQTNGKETDQTLSKSQGLWDWRATRPWGQTMRRQVECWLRAICQLWQRMEIWSQSKTAAILGSNFLQYPPMNCLSWRCPTRRKLPISRKQPTKSQLYHPRISVQPSARRTKKTRLAKNKRSRVGAEVKVNEPCYAELTMSSWMIWHMEQSPSWTSRLLSRMQEEKALKPRRAQCLWEKFNSEYLSEQTHTINDKQGYAIN